MLPGEKHSVGPLPESGEWCSRRKDGGVGTDFLRDAIGGPVVAVGDDCALGGIEDVAVVGAGGLEVDTVSAELRLGWCCETKTYRMHHPLPLWILMRRLLVVCEDPLRIRRSLETEPFIPQHRSEILKYRCRVFDHVRPAPILQLLELGELRFGCTLRVGEEFEELFAFVDGFSVLRGIERVSGFKEDVVVVVVFFIIIIV